VLVEQPPRRIKCRAIVATRDLKIVVARNAGVVQLGRVVEERRSCCCRGTPRVTADRAIRSAARCRGAVESLYELVLQYVWRIDAIERLGGVERPLRSAWSSRLRGDENDTVGRARAVDCRG